MKKVISIALALILLLSNMGLTFGTHYCGGHAVKTNLLNAGIHLGCGMEMDDEPACSNENSQQSHLDKKPCCENEYLFVQVEDEFNTSSEISSLIKFAVAFTEVFIFKIPSDFQLQSNFQYQYPPPLLKENVQVLFQTFIL